MRLKHEAERKLGQLKRQLNHIGPQRHRAGMVVGQTDRQTDRQMKRYKDRQADKQTDRYEYYGITEN